MARHPRAEPYQRLWHSPGPPLGAVRHHPADPEVADEPFYPCHVALGRPSTVPACTRTLTLVPGEAGDDLVRELIEVDATSVHPTSEMRRGSHVVTRGQIGVAARDQLSGEVLQVELDAAAGPGPGQRTSHVPLHGIPLRSPTERPPGELTNYAESPVAIGPALRPLLLRTAPLRNALCITAGTA